MSALANALVRCWLLFCILRVIFLSRTEPQEFQRDHDRRCGPETIRAVDGKGFRASIALG
jgi:hypothetical protein